jgi:hypothetical protein
MGMVTVKTLGAMSLCKSGLVTSTCQSPPAAAYRSKVPVIMVGLSTTDGTRLMLLIPLVIRAVAPSWKYWPDKLVIETMFPVSPLSGLMLYTMGASEVGVGGGEVGVGGGEVGVGGGEVGVGVGGGKVGVGVGGGVVGVAVGTAVGLEVIVLVGRGVLVAVGCNVGDGWGVGDG